MIDETEHAIRFSALALRPDYRISHIIMSAPFHWDYLRARSNCAATKHNGPNKLKRPQTTIKARDK